MIEQAKNTFFNMLRNHAVATSRSLSLDVNIFFIIKYFQYLDFEIFEILIKRSAHQMKLIAYLIVFHIQKYKNLI